MDKQEYLNSLKTVDLRPGKVKFHERKEPQVLMEQEFPKETIGQAIINWFEKNPDPSDDQIKTLAREWDMTEDQLEEEIYKVLTDYIKTESASLNEIFIQTSEIEAMEDGEVKDAAMLRLSIIAELDAANLYERFADIASTQGISEVMLDIAKEEKVHAGEFQTLLDELDDEYKSSREKGEGEVNDLLSKHGMGEESGEEPQEEPPPEEY
jgi:hypothetical protein